MDADARPAAIRACWSAASPPTSAAAIASAAGASSSSRATSTTAPSSTRPPSSSSTCPTSPSSTTSSSTTPTSIADVDAVELAFKRLAVLVPRNGLLLLGADSPRAAALAAHARSPVETFGLSGDPTWQATDLAVGDAGTRFKVRRHGDAVRHVRGCRCSAQHNVRNALAGHRRLRRRSGSTPRHRRRACAPSQGVKRRLELRGIGRRRSTVYDDFAHHPTAVAETIAALRLAHPDRRHLGDLRAALGLVVPEGVPGRFRRGVRGRRRRRGRAGVPREARRGSAACRRPSSSPTCVAKRPLGARAARRPRRSSTTSRARRAPRRSRSW